MDPYFTGEPLRIGSETQLLIDDTVVEDRWRLERRLNAPSKYARNPVLMKDKPWEGDQVISPTVLWDEAYGRYRMWYTCFNRSHYEAGGGPVYYIAYAESDDGYTWEKPLFDHCPLGPYAKTNIVYYGTHEQGLPGRKQQRVQKGQIFIDPADPDPARRYKLICLEGRPKPELGEVHSEMNLTCSPDGIHWSLSGERSILDHHSDCANHVVYNPREGRWLLYCRPTIYNSGRSGGQRHHRRRVSLMTSTDFENWSYPRTVLYPDEYDLPDYDHVHVFPYGNLYLMLYAAMEGDDTGRDEVRLASSADGARWERFHTRAAFLGRGGDGAWDCGTVIPSGDPVRQGEYLLFYYSGANLGQHECGDRQGGAGVARLKVDRFVGQWAGDREPGYLLTKEFLLEGNRLRVNLEPDKRPYHTPRLRAEILRHPPIGQHATSKEVYDGFSLDDCDPLAIDHTDALITWRGSPDLSALKGQPVYVRFELFQAGLYAFCVADE
ncbi:MAG: sialidase family protein [Armatimonadota bacterium]